MSVEQLQQWASAFEGVIWGPWLIVLLVGTGIFLSIGTRFVQFRRLGDAFALLFKRGNGESGDITPFQALMTSLSATIGTGNIAGVAGAIVLGGPGAVFWMWVTGSIGGALKFGEAMLAIKYRHTNEEGEQSGGPMYYIKYGMAEKFGGNWHWLGFAFALFAVIASLGIGNMTQANSIALVLEQSLGLNPTISGVVLAVVTGLVIVGGIKSIAKVTEKVVPIMAIFYVVGGLVVLMLNASAIPTALGWIFSNAFSSKAVAGGLLGSVIRFGVARGLFSNEAGLGSAAIAHASAKTDNPIQQGIIASLGSFIDTLLICTMTALVILTSGIVTLDADTGKMIITALGANGQVLNGAALTEQSFGSTFNAARYIVSLGLMFFAFSTIIGWYFYGVKSLEFVMGSTKFTRVYQLVWVTLIWVGSVLPLGVVWALSGAFNGLMALPNLIALLSLSGVIFAALKEYEHNEKEL